MNFKHYYLEAASVINRKDKAYVFDLDDTLFKTGAKIEVVDSNGKIIKSLTPAEFNTYRLEPGETFKFEQFRDPKIFKDTSKPLPLIRLPQNVTNAVNKNKSDSTLYVLTARGDEVKKVIIQVLKNHGIDVDPDNVFTVGNGDPNKTIAERKWDVLNLIRNGGKYKNNGKIKEYRGHIGKIEFYDDDEANRQAAREIKGIEAKPEWQEKGIRESTMNFRLHFLLTEEIKETDIIDLYIIMAMGKPLDPQYQDIYDNILAKTSNNIKLEIQNILLRELRHATEATRGFGFGDKKLKDLFPAEDVDPYAIKVSLDWLAKNWSSKRELSIDHFAAISNVPWTIDSVIRAFRNLDWIVSYGGDNWATIAEQAKALLEAGPGDIISALDRFVDFVHNTGAVANKFKGFESGWLNFILDLKAQSKNVRELIPYASYEVKQLFKDPGWRGIHLGLGAAESDQVIINMVKKYLPDIINTLPDLSEWLTKTHEIDTDSDYKEQLSHVNLFKLINDYTIDRVANAINTEREKDSQFANLVDEFIMSIYDYISYVGDLKPQQKRFLKLIGWDPYADYGDDEDGGKKKKKKGLKKSTYKDPWGRKKKKF